GLLTVTGGKWTTYRAIADDVLEHCQRAGLLPRLSSARTAQHRLIGASSTPVKRDLSEGADLRSYGDEAAFVNTLEGRGVEIIEGLSEAMVRFAARYEYALTVEDVLARRVRTLFLDARLTAKAAPRVAEVLLQE